MSSAWPMRAVGVRAANGVTFSGTLHTDLFMSVAVMPGATALMRTPGRTVVDAQAAHHTNDRWARLLESLLLVGDEEATKRGEDQVRVRMRPAHVHAVDLIGEGHGDVGDGPFGCLRMGATGYIRPSMADRLTFPQAPVLLAQIGIGHLRYSTCTRFKRSSNTFKIYA